MNLTRRNFAGIMVVSAATAAAAMAGCSSTASSSTDSEESTAETAPASTEADLIVVGAGGAGLAGAAKAAQGGASVIVLEAAGATGGTTAICGGHYKFMDDDLLALLPERTDESDDNLRTLLDLTIDDLEEGYEDTLSKLQADIQEYLDGDSTQEFDSLEMWLVLHYLGVTGDQLDPDGVSLTPSYELIHPAYEGSAAIKDWLVEGGFEYEAFGSNFGDDGGPFSVNPTGPAAQGMAYITILQGYAEDAGAQIITNAKVTSLVEDGGRIVGVQTEDGTTYTANQAVLLACGGFASNSERVIDEDIRWDVQEGVASCEPETNDGTGLAAAEAIGASTSNLGFIQYQTFPYHGAATIETTVPVCAAAAMAVNKDGVRFRDDSFMFGTQSTDVSLEQTETAYYLIGDNKTLEMLADVQDRYETTGDLVVADTIEECAEGHDLPADAVAAEVEKFNGYVDDGEDPDFGRHIETEGEQATKKVDEAPFWIMSMKEYGQHTMGGVCIDPTGHVVDDSGNPIEGLFAAGEIVGNLDGAQRRHGDNFAQLLYYGTLCGETVAENI